MKPIFTRLRIVLLLVLVAACSHNGHDETDFLVTINTDMGAMVAILYKETSQHKENFLKLSYEGFYDSLLFHRVVDQFIIQGGDPESKNAPQGQPLGTGSPGYTIPAEIVPALFHEKGALAAARQRDGLNPEKRSSGSQFYIVQGTTFTKEQIEINALLKAASQLINTMPDDTLSAQMRQAYEQGGDSTFQQKAVELKDQILEKTGATLTKPEEQLEVYAALGGTPHLDGDYTVFGKVIDGLDVLDRIASVETAPDHRPLEDIHMHITVEKMAKSQITKKYGYTYED